MKIGIISLKMKKVLAVCFFILFITFSLYITSIPSDELIQIVGTNNSYILMLVLAFIGGLTTFSGLPYHLVLLNLTAGGVNPVLLGLTTAVGVILGDSTSYLWGSQGAEFIPKIISTRLQKIANFIDRNPRYLFPGLLLYGAMSPFSNDFIIMSMGLIKYSYKKVIIPLGIGNIIFNIMIALLGYYAFDEVKAYF